MPKSPTRKRPLLALAALAVAALAGTGCGTGKADTERGRELFIQNCGTCHQLAQAGTTAQVGPDLDDAFAPARAAGMDSDTVEGVVSGQIANPRPDDNPVTFMPADIVTGQDAEDVAAYVAQYAGVPGAAPPRVPGGPGAQVFANYGCGGCHTLAEANSGGVTGPNLDEVLAGQGAAMIRRSIVDPNADITQGYPADVMPTDYEQTIPEDELNQLVQFLLRSSRGGGAQG